MMPLTCNFNFTPKESPSDPFDPFHPYFENFEAFFEGLCPLTFAKISKSPQKPKTKRQKDKNHIPSNKNNHTFFDKMAKL